MSALADHIFSSTTQLVNFSACPVHFKWLQMFFIRLLQIKNFQKLKSLKISINFMTSAMYNTYSIILCIIQTSRNSTIIKYHFRIELAQKVKIFSNQLCPKIEYLVRFLAKRTQVSGSLLVSQNCIFTK